MWTLVCSLLLIRAAGLVDRRGRAAIWMLHRRSRRMLTALGIRVVTTGSPREGAALVVGNHQSFLDILVFAAQTPLRQVAKREVGQWPLIGELARRTGTLFLDRRAYSQLPSLVDDMAAALRTGAKVQAFPEATTRCGDAIDELHRCVFQAAIDAAVVVAPVTLRYTDAAGMPCNTGAFLGDESVVEALRRTIAMRGLTVHLHWLPPIPAIAGTGHRATDRARLTDQVQDAIARDLQVPVVWRRAAHLPVVLATADRTATGSIAAA